MNPGVTRAHVGMRTPLASTWGLGALSNYPQLVHHALNILQDRRVLIRERFEQKILVIALRGK